MRVQMQARSLRLRLQEDELHRLLDGDTVENRTPLPDGRQAVQQVHLARATAWQSEDTTWRIALPVADVADYATRLPTRDGLRYSLDTSDGALELQFDVDVRDSVRRRHPRRERDAD